MRALRLLVIAGVAVGVLTAVALTKSALADTPSVKGKEAAKVDKSKAKVFRLAHTDPEEVKQVMEGLLEYIPVEAPPPAVPPMPVPMGMLGAGGFMGALGVPPTFSIAVEPRTRSLVVRGTEKHVQMAADLVAVVDQAPGKEPPEVKSLRAVMLKHAKAEDLAAVIEQLEFDGKVIALPVAKMLVFTGTDTVMKEIGELVKELDVEATPEPKKGDKRKLFEDPPPEVKK